MISKVQLLPQKQCRVHVGGHVIDMPVRHALKQDKFGEHYTNATNRVWFEMAPRTFRVIMRKRFEDAGFDFNYAPLANYGKDA